MDLSKLMSAASKKGKQKNTKVADSDTDFFITNKENSSST